MLKVDLKLMNNVIVGQVLEQDESLRGKGMIFSDEKVNIRSFEVPELNDHDLFIRGETKSDDNNCFCHSYNSADEAKEFYDAFLKAIEKINEKDDELWLPKHEGVYYRIITTGEVIRDRNTGSDEKIFAANNVFKSKEVAGKVVKSTRLHWLLWRLKEKYCPDYEFILNKANYALLYSREEKKWDCDCWSRWDYNAPYFDKKSVKKAVDYLNSHKELWEDLI